MHFISNTQTEYELIVYLRSNTPKRDQFCVGENLAVELFDGRVVIIPLGFVSDAHSTPPWLNSILPHFDSRTNLAAIVHDFLYMHWETFDGRHAGLDRQYADVAYLKLMEQIAPGHWRNRLYYRAVRVLGWINWNRFRAHKA